MVSGPDAAVPILVKLMPPAGVPPGVEFFVRFEAQVARRPAACVKSPPSNDYRKRRVGDRDFESEVIRIPVHIGIVERDLVNQQVRR